VFRASWKLSSTLAARAWDKPVTAVFVPDANASNYRPGMPLYSCKLLLVMCSQTGKTGQRWLKTSVKPTRCSAIPCQVMPCAYVEAIVSDKAQPRGALVHAGGKPIVFLTTAAANLRCLKTNVRKMAS
jgi:hypothetical protein